jgi:hypothetical protein
MLKRFKKTARLISLPVIAILLTSPAWLTFVETAEAESVKNSNSRSDKVSPLMKGNNRRADRSGSSNLRMRKLYTTNGCSLLNGT